ncbi:HepT-like ribonuclease domain-containing protein [Egicoccus sp. AB-alg2]|uniref:type VII toxin-antitoxin system HepT family RNase toxin n=1 Tax=Egicoccus sp. AB-alg2 TaxID=3242693 RepID=UPI00359D2E17
MELPVEPDRLQAVLRRHGMRFAFVFGSRAEGTAGEDSDLDLVVWADEAIDDWALRGELPDDVDLVDLRRTPEGLAGRIALTGLVILDDDPAARVRWQADTRKRHLDEAFRRQRYRDDFVRAHVDADRQLAVLGRVTARLRVLEEYAQQDADDLLTDDVRLGHLEYTFQTAIEAGIDAAQHVAAADGLGVPASNADVFRLLAGAGVIDDVLATSMARAVGFRNVLVHDYADVDDRLVVENLARLPDLHQYVRSMTRLLAETDDG